MDSKLPSRSYQDYEPKFESKKEGRNDVLVFDLAGFKKENLRVQVDRHGNLKVSGERPLYPLKDNCWSHFRKEFRVPDDCNTTDIRAKFDNGVLSILLPRPIEVDAQDATPMDKKTDTEQTKLKQNEASKPTEEKHPKPEEKEATKPTEEKHSKQEEKEATKPTEATQPKPEENEATKSTEEMQEKEEKEEELKEKEMKQSAMEGKFKFENGRFGSKIKRSRGVVVVGVVMTMVVVVGLVFYIMRRFDNNQGLLELDGSV